MDSLLSKFEYINFGHTPLTEFNLYDRIRDISGVEIIWTDSDFAFGFIMHGRQFLVLPKGQRGMRMLFAAFLIP
jgi:hypothetical protein